VETEHAQRIKNRIIEEYTNQFVENRDRIMNLKIFMENFIHNQNIKGFSITYNEFCITLIENVLNADFSKIEFSDCNGTYDSIVKVINKCIMNIPVDYLIKKKKVRLSKLVSRVLFPNP